jgi:hypothetical protein
MRQKGKSLKAAILLRQSNIEHSLFTFQIFQRIEYPDAAGKEKNNEKDIKHVNHKKPPFTGTMYYFPG